MSLDQLWRLTPQEYIALQREHRKRERASAAYRESLVRVLVEAVYGSQGRTVTWANGGGGAQSNGTAKRAGGFTSEEQRMLDDAARAFYGG